MKKKILLLVISCAPVFVFAQPTFDFETWNGNEPSGWVSGNEIMLFGNPQSVFQETASVHGGTKAMKIVTVTLANNPDPANIPNPIGAAFPGVVSMSPLGLKDGFQYTSRPATADFWYKYTPVGGDSAGCYIQLSKWNTNRDTIAVGGVVIKTAASSYTSSTINLIYNPAFSAMLPDTMRIYFTATCYTTLSCGTAGSTLWVDDVTFSGWNGINEHPSSNGVILYPNPASEFVNISADAQDAASAIVYDATGRIVTSSSPFEQMNAINRKSGIINTSTLSSGLYSYSVVDNSGNILRAGKFSVVK